MIIKRNFLFVLFFTILFSSLVSAQYYDSGYGVERFIDLLVENLEPILIALFGGDDYTGYLLFEKLLLFLLVSIIVFLSLSNFPLFQDRNKNLVKIIAIIVALLGIRNLDYVWLNTIFTQYAVLFIAVAGVLPFVIYWFFLKDMNSFPRKVGWIFFAVVYIGLWITTTIPAHESVYLISALVALAYAFFLDATVHNWIEIQDIKKGNKARLSSAIGKISEEIEIIDNRLVGGHYRGRRAANLAEEKIKRLEKRIRKLQKGL